MSKDTCFYVVVTRHLEGHDPVVTDISEVTSDYDCIESHAEEILSDIREKFVSKLPEFKYSKWYVHHERRF